jgi:enolase
VPAVITYLEDPIHSAEHGSWFKLTEKFKSTKVKIGSRNLYTSLENIKKVSEPLPDNAEG